MKNVIFILAFALGAMLAALSQCDYRTVQPATPAAQVEVVAPVVQPQDTALVALEATEEPSAPEATLYTVEKGDTLWGIAKAHYGTGTKFGAIFDANTGLVVDPDEIWPGQRLRIPAIPAS
jgi:nucleoid-associated protein YgaU